MAVKKINRGKERRKYTSKVFLDFHLFQLKPLRGSFVMGFGKAYTISGEKMDLLEHMKIKKNF